MPPRLALLLIEQAPSATLFCYAAAATCIRAHYSAHKTTRVKLSRM